MRRGEELGAPSLMELTDDTPHLGYEVVVSTSTYPWPRHLPTREEALSGQSLACQASTTTKKVGLRTDWQHVDQHTHFQAQHMFSVARRIKVVFRFFCCTAIFRVWLLRWKSAWCAE